ncbi:MAG: FeoA family protein [bacterium]|nr:FeoA family protein [bacterium]
MLGTMIKSCSLCDASEGMYATIENVDCEDNTKAQLNHMGLVKGAIIRVLKQSHLVLVEIGRSRLALPKELGQFIHLSSGQN